MKPNLCLVIVLVLLLLLLIFRNSSNFKNINADSKVLIHSPGNMLTEGAFGQALIYTLEALEILEKEGIQPENVVFDVNTNLYGKLVPGMMNPQVINQIDNFDKKIELSQETSQIFKEKDRNRTEEEIEEYFDLYNHLFNKWFRIPEEVFPKVPHFDGNKTLGIHYRGTDKTHDKFEYTDITSDEFVLIIKDFLHKHREIDTLFIATDDANFIPKVTQNIPNMKIVQFNQTRSSNGKSLHKSTKFEGNDKIINPWIDVVALSRCKYVLRISSALSAWAKILNPDLEIYQVNATRQPWAPTVFIPSYRSDTPEIKRILDRTLKGNYFGDR